MSGLVTNAGLPGKMQENISGNVETRQVVMTGSATVNLEASTRI